MWHAALAWGRERPNRNQQGLRVAPSANSPRGYMVYTIGQKGPGLRGKIRPHARWNGTEKEIFIFSKKQSSEPDSLWEQCLWPNLSAHIISYHDTYSENRLDLVWRHHIRRIVLTEHSGVQYAGTENYFDLQNNSTIYKNALMVVCGIKHCTLFKKLFFFFLRN